MKWNESTKVQSLGAIVSMNIRVSYLQIKWELKCPGKANGTAYALSIDSIEDYKSSLVKSTQITTSVAINNEAIASSKVVCQLWTTANLDHKLSWKLGRQLLIIFFPGACVFSSHRVQPARIHSLHAMCKVRIWRVFQTYKFRVGKDHYYLKQTNDSEEDARCQSCQELKADWIGSSSSL